MHLNIIISSPGLTVVDSLRSPSDENLRHTTHQLKKFDRAKGFYRNVSGNRVKETGEDSTFPFVHTV